MTLSQLAGHLSLALLDDSSIDAYFDSESIESFFPLSPQT
jgi:hypothetical protein